MTIPLHNTSFSYKNTTLFNHTCLDKTILQENSLDLIITSPPYNVGIEYNSNEDSNSYESYLEFSQKWIEIATFGQKMGQDSVLISHLIKTKADSKAWGRI